MTDEDLDQVLRIERGAFPTPWTRQHFQHELHANRYGWNVVLEERGEIVAYASSWILRDELHINEFAVHPGRRREGIGRRLLDRMLREARARGCVLAALEVRPSNSAARNLYSKRGFREVGRRKGYYSDTAEDAVLMCADLRPSTP